MTNSTTSLELLVTESAQRARRGEPVRLGVPLASGRANRSTAWELVDATSQAVTCQCTPLGQWPDGSVRWLLVEFLASVAAGATARFELRSKATQSPASDRASSATNSASARPSPDSQTLFEFGSRGSAPSVQSTCRLVVTDTSGQSHVGQIEHVTPLDAGPVVERWQLHGRLPKLGLRFTAVLSAFAGQKLAHCVVTLENHGRARHRDGYWDLGDDGSVRLVGAALELSAQAGAGAQVHYSAAADAATRVAAGALSIQQESSGGEAWNSANHVDHDGQIPLRFRGFQLSAGDLHESGLRASPVVAIAGDLGALGGALVEFWQKFPSGIAASPTALALHLIPRNDAHPQELQGGERLTREAWLALGARASDVGEALRNCLDPLVARCAPQGIWESQSLFALPDPETPVRDEARSLLAAALDGTRSLFAKREVADEYGWRNFGDMWADHEQAYSDEPPPIVSHYNNQYDMLHGLLNQFLLTGDRRWWELADPLARHILDIDLYQTTHDKSAYSGGMFWHTAHYLGAATASHRTHSRQMRGKRYPSFGGGPGNEHNYSTGLLLYYYLTGNLRAKQAVVGLAEWVLAMDDGSAHVLGLVSDRPTGFASATSEVTYHGPGRGAGNSIQALIDGWQVSGEPRFLAKVEELIRRTIHPADNIPSRDLLNAELRWSYTVYLQALHRFLAVVPESSVSSDLHAYVRAALVAYADWMAEHERCYFDVPEQLEFPTETWAVHDLRKGNLLLFAAQLAVGDRRALYVRRGHEFLEKAWAKLMTFPSATCTRAMALVLQQSPVETYHAANPAALANDRLAEPPSTWGEPTTFVSQKEHVKQLIRRPWRHPGAFARLLNPARWWRVWSRSWPAQKWRQRLGRG